MLDYGPGEVVGTIDTDGNLDAESETTELICIGTRLVPSGTRWSARRPGPDGSPLEKVWLSLVSMRETAYSCAPLHSAAVRCTRTYRVALISDMFQDEPDDGGGHRRVGGDCFYVSSQRRQPHGWY